MNPSHARPQLSFPLSHPESPAQEFSRSALADQGWEAIHRPRNLTKADVSRLEWPPHSGEFVILKDLSQRPLWFRVLLGRFLMAREWRALCALQELDVAPQPIERVDPDAFVMGYVAGQQLSKRAEVAQATPLLREAERVLGLIHDHGVTHGDLHRANLLFDESGRACVVDWASGSVFGTDFGPKKWTQREWQRLDKRAIAKLKRRHAPELLSPDEINLLERQTPVQRWVRASGQWARAVLGLRCR